MRLCFLLRICVLFGLFRWIFLVYMNLCVLFRGTFVYCVGEPLCVV
jgi:hypothetical protein